MTNPEYIPFTGELDATPEYEPFTGKLDGEEKDGAFVRGLKRAKQSATITTKLATGDTAGTAETIRDAEIYNQQNPSSKESDELSKAWEDGDGITGGIAGVGREFAKDWRESKGFVSGLRETGKNVNALREGIVSQLGNSVAPMVGLVAGGAAGAAAGTAVPVVGNIAGGIAGGWAGAAAGNTLVEGGGQLQDALHKANIDPMDTVAVEKFVAENGDKILGQSAIKGGIIGAVDTATAGIAGRLLNVPARAAVNRALVDMGVDVADKIAVKEAMKNSAAEISSRLASDTAYQASRTGAENIARNAGAAALDHAGEFTGEYVGQGAATGDWNTKNAALEALSSVGQSGAMFAGQKGYQALTNPFRNGKTGEAAPQSNTPITDAAQATGAFPQLPAPSITVNADGTAETAEDRNARIAARAAGDIADVTPIPNTPEYQDVRGFAPAARQMQALEAPTITVDGNGQALTAQDRNNRLSDRLSGGVTDVTPIQRAPEVIPPSRAMGLNPAKGSLSGAAAMAVDSGASVFGSISQQGALNGQQTQEAQQTGEGQSQGAGAQERVAAAPKIRAVKLKDGTTAHVNEADLTSGASQLRTFTADGKPRAARLDAAAIAPPPPKVVLQNRNRATPASIAQMNAIAGKPDFLRTGASNTMDNGAPIVFGDLPQKVAIGRAQMVADGNGQRVPTQYAVVEAQDLITSNHADGSPVAEYANGVDGKLRAVAGNGRAAGLKAAWQRGTAGQYGQELVQDAPNLGIAPEVLAQFEAPVLVRVMDAADVTPDMGDRSNVQAGLQMSAVEQASNDAQRLNLRDMEFDELGNPTAQTVMRFMQGMPVQERGNMLDSQGRATSQLLDRIRAAAFKQAYMSDSLVELAAQSADPEAKNILNGLAIVAGDMAQLAGAGDFDIRQAVTDAANMAVTAGRTGQSIAQYLQTRQIDENPETVVVMQFMAQNVRSAKRIADGLRAWAELAQSQIAIARQNAEQDTMFGDTPTLSRRELFERLNNDNLTEIEQQQLIEQQRRAELTKQGTQRPSTERAGNADGASDGAESRGTEPTNAQDAGREQADFALAQQTPEQIRAQEEAQAQAARDKAKEDARAAEVERKAVERQEVTQRSKAAANDFQLGQSAEDNLSGQGDIFAQQQEADAESLRFEVGKSLTNAQRQQVLASLVDAYKAKGAQREFKGLDGNGNERYGYIYSPDLFEKSDITGAMVRYYVTLPDGRIAHPSELFPEVSASDIERMAQEQNAKRIRLDAYENAIKPYYSDFDSANLMAAQDQAVIEKSGRFAIIPKRPGAIGQARQNGWGLASPSGQESEQGSGTRAVREQQEATPEAPPKTLKEGLERVRAKKAAEKPAKNDATRLGSGATGVADNALSGKDAGAPYQYFEEKTGLIRDVPSMSNRDGTLNDDGKRLAYTEWSAMSEDERALIHEAIAARKTRSQQADDSVRKEYLRAEKARLEGGRIILSSNGNPYKTEGAAAKFIEEKGIEESHYAGKVDGGWAAVRRTPSEMLERENGKKGIEDYTTIQSRVVAEMGLTQAWGEDAITDAQWEKIDNRVDAIQRGQRGLPPVEQATDEAKPAPDKDGNTIVGRRADGVMIRQDKQGVRFYFDSGVRISEAVSLRPTRAGMQIDRGELKPDFMTAEESAERDDEKPKQTEAATGNVQQAIRDAVQTDHLTNEQVDQVAAIFDRAENQAKNEQPNTVAATEPKTVSIPQDIYEALTKDMQKQQARVKRLRAQAEASDLDLEGKKAAQLKVSAAEATLRKMRTSRFDAEDAALASIEAGSADSFAHHADFFPSVSEVLAKNFDRAEGKAKKEAKPAPAAKPPSADKTRAKADLMNALADLGDILGKGNKLFIVPEQEQKLLPVLARVLDAAFRLGYHKFKDASKFALDQMRKHLGDEAADALTIDHLQGAYIAMAGGKKGVDTKRAVIDVETKAEIESHEAVAVDEDGDDSAEPQPINKALPAPAAPKTLAESLFSAIKDGRMPKDNPALKKLVEAFDGRPADQARMKEGQEELETAIVMASREIVANKESDQSTFETLLRLYESQPNLNIRTSTSIANQAYSTPAPLAYLASRLAGITQSTVVHEPTGGTGMLLIGADPQKSIVNELNDLRIATLKSQGFKPTQKDAATQLLVPDGTQTDAVVTNPPFGSLKDGEGKTVKVRVDGFNLGQIDHLIAARALNTLKDDGRATLILGANKVAGGLSTDDRIFFNWLYSNYSVVGHFEVNGDLYTRQGAGWPVRVITINGRKKSSGISPLAGTIQRADNWDQVYEQFKKNIASADAPRNTAKQDAVEAGGKPTTTVATPQAASGQRPKNGTRGDGNVAGAVTRNVPDSAKPDGGAVATVADEQRINAQSYVPKPQQGQGDAGGDRPSQPTRDAALENQGAAGNEFQSPYTPRSSRKDEGVLIPANMAQPTQDALNRIEDAVGDIDEYARSELGYDTVADLHNALMGLQVDSVATAIYQIKQGKAVVIADQTGIGKGRQAASIIRWAAKQGLTPVFVSVKPSLFTDMYGDLADIGTNDVAPFIMNSAEWIAGEGGEKLFTNKPADHKRTIEGIASTAELPDGSNAVFLTYSQINVANAQRRALMALAPNAVFILDESHNAAGASATGEFMIGALDAAKGVVYLSATYAKRPDNMPLYFKTDIGEAAADTEGLALAMASGGLPLQTVVSNNLVKAGQMFRRERSYDGVSIESIFDTPNKDLHERMSDEATKALRAIVAADRMFHNVFVKAMSDELAEQGATVQDSAGNQIDAGVEHTEFSSVVHNFVKQMLLGLKAQPAADSAIASLKRGEKPIIAVESTMGSFLNEYAASNGIAQGASLGAFDYRTVLTRALSRSRVIIEVTPGGDKVKRAIPLGALDAVTRAAYDDAQAVIDGLTLNIPVSPIDWMRAEIQRAGFSVAEITGRNLSVDYSDPKNPILSALDQSEQKDKVNTTRQFNSGKLDALVLNVAGSTGISLHASEKFEDQRQRHMIVAQAAGDINIFMQMLGRVHRTGQVRLPKYSILSADLPTEKRPTAVLSNKMKSLNANTSSNTESATSVKSSDILNKYGDQIVNQYLIDNYPLAVELDLTKSIGTDFDEDLARKATGRLALQPIATQNTFYEEVESQYASLIEYLNKTNQNDLDPRTFDFDAKETRQEVLFDGPDKSTPFGEDAIYGEYSIKAQGTPMKPEEIHSTMAENLGGLTSDAHAQKMLSDLDAKYNTYYASLEDMGKDSAISVRNAGRDFVERHKIGSMFRVDINGEPFNAVVLNVRNLHKESGNPYSMSKMQVSVAINGAIRSLSVPATQFSKIEVSTVAAFFKVEQLFKEQPPNQRETAKIVTGNLLAAYGELKGVRGTIITFTKNDGTSEQGILLPKLFDYSKNTQGDYRLKTSADALKFLQTSDSRDIGRFGISSRDGVVRVLPYGKGIRVQVPKSKLRGAKYFLDKGLIDAGGDFVSSGGLMVATIEDAGKARQVLDLLSKKQALYALPSMAEEAKAMLEKQGTAPSRANPKDSSAENDDIAFFGAGTDQTETPSIRYSRGTNEAMTNNDVVGNQGGRSADDTTPGGTHPFNGFTREQFLGNPKITSDANAKDLVPSTWKSLESEKNVPFAIGSGLTARYSELSAAVYNEKGDVVASYSFGDTLVVNKKYRRQGIGSELVYQWRMRNPNSKTAATRTKKSQLLQEKVWNRIRSERALYESRIHQDSNEPTAQNTADSRASTAAQNPSNPSQVWAAIEGVFEGIDGLRQRLDAGTTVVRNADELPQQFQQAAKDAQAQGFYDDKSKRIYLVADRIEAGQEKAVWLHEVFHKRGSELLGDTVMARLHGAVQRWGARKAGSVERQIYDAAHARAQADGNYNGEFLAYAIEEAVNRGVQPDLKANITSAGYWLGRVREAFANAMAKLTGAGVRTGTFRAEDLVAAAYGAAGLEVAGKGAAKSMRTEAINRLAEEARFAQEATPLQQFKETEQRIGGQDAYAKAKAEGKTKLNYGQWVQVRTPAFKAWFGDWEGDPANASKVVDSETGEPLVVYHGSRFGGFSVFVRSAGGFIYTTPNADYASRFSGASDGSAVYPVYVSIKKPLDLTHLGERSMSAEEARVELKRLGVNLDEVQPWEGAPAESVKLYGDGPIWRLIREDRFSIAAKNAGFDGIKINEGDGETAWVAFESNQIKSATGNTGAFDSSNPDIRFSRASPTTGAGVWQAPEATKFDQYTYLLQDKQIDSKRVVNAIKENGKQIADDLDVYLQETLFHGRAAKRVKDFAEQEELPLIELLRDKGLELSELEEYLHARHAPEANWEMSERNPNKAMIEERLKKAVENIAAVEVSLRRAPTDKNIRKEMLDAEAELSKWRNAKPYKGEESDRLALSGMSNEEAAAVMDSLDATKRKNLQAAAKMVDRIIAKTRETIVDYGLESQDTVDAWGRSWDNYVPLMREQLDDVVMGGIGTGQGFSVKGKETKGRTGSTKKVVDILANINMQRERAIVRGEENRVATALLGLVKDNPNKDFWHIAEPGEIPSTQVIDKKTGLVTTQIDPLFKSRDNALIAKVNGVEKVIIFNEDNPRATRMAVALKNMDAANLEGLLGSVASATRYLAAVNTQYNPIFGIVNMVRDFQEAAINMQKTPLAGKQKQVLGNAPKAIWQIGMEIRAQRNGKQTGSEYGSLWEEFQEQGGQTGYRDMFNNSAERSKQLQNLLKPDAWADTKAGRFFTVNGALKVPLEILRKTALRPMLDLLSDYNEAIENGVRLSAYKAALDIGMSKPRAAELAKNLTVNFNRKGQVAQQVGALYAFFNASVQGTARMGQTIFDMEPGKPKTIRLSSLGKKIVGGGVLLGSVQALLLAASGFGDDEPPEFIRKRNLVIPNPLSEKGYISIPMPLGYHVLTNLGRIPTEYALSGFKGGSKRAISLLDVMSDIYNPIGGSGLSMQTLAPSVLDPFAALAENKDFTGRAIAKQSFNKVTPGHALGRDTSTLLAQGMSKAVNYATGGTEYTRGELSPTPDQIDYLIGQVTGGVGREASKVSQSTQAIATGDELPWHKVPLVGRFYGDADSPSAKQSAYYNLMDDVRRHSAEVKGLRNDGKATEAIEYMAENPQATLHIAANAAERQVKKLRDRMDDLKEQNAPRESIKEVETQMTEVMQRFAALVQSKKKP